MGGMDGMDDMETPWTIDGMDGGPSPGLAHRPCRPFPSMSSIPRATPPLRCASAAPPPYPINSASVSVIASRNRSSIPGDQASATLKYLLAMASYPPSAMISAVGK